MSCSSFQAKFILILGFVIPFFIGFSIYSDVFLDNAQRYPYIDIGNLLRNFWTSDENEFSNCTGKDWVFHTPKQQKVVSNLAKGIHIAVGGGITLRVLTPTQLGDILNGYHFFTHLLPSFCATASPFEFHYHLYFGYDEDDKYFCNSDNLWKFRTAFKKTLKKSCPNDLNLSLTVFKCSHSIHPAWAQNDAMMAAYIDGMEFFYRINDDTRFDSKGWVELFVEALDGYKPIRVGVVGPTHDWGNLAVLTYDFVHRTHIDIFGFYYPRPFTDWFADTWITEVYGIDRMKKLFKVKLQHSHEQGTRYKPNINLRKLLPGIRDSCRDWLNFAIKTISSGAYNGSYDKLIVMSITKLTPLNLYGAIRNAQLLPVFYPDGWILRVYIPMCISSINIDGVKRTLQRLRAEIFSQPCSTDITSISYINAFHSLSNTVYRHVIVRSPVFRFSDRESHAVKDWITSNTSFHIIRDHPTHVNLSVVPQLWGMRSRDFVHNIMRKRSFPDLLADISTSNYTSEISILSKFILPFVNNSVLESVTQFLPKAAILCRNNSMGVCCISQYIGQTFNEHMIPTDFI